MKDKDAAVASERRQTNQYLIEHHPTATRPNLS